MKSKRYIQIRKDEIYTDSSAATLDTSTMTWQRARLEMYQCNLKEWIIHNILRKHFTFGQPYCVVCGYAEKIKKLADEN